MNTKALIAFLLAAVFSAYGDDTTPPIEPSPSVYTLPWQLRSVTPTNLVRLDSAESFYNDKSGNSGGRLTGSMLTGGYKLTQDVGIVARMGMANNLTPLGSNSGTSFSNPLLGGVYSISLPSHLRLGLFLGMTVPVGSGGGNIPDPAAKAANSAATLARSGMDNSLFAVNYLSVIPGAGLAYIADNLTVQLEATLFQSTRTRGEAVDADGSRTNFTTGLMVGYAFTENVSGLGELRYQHWLVNGAVSNSANPPIQNLSLAIGPRFNFSMFGIKMKPGLAYVQGLVGPIATGGFTYPTNSHKIFFIDLPIYF